MTRPHSPLSPDRHPQDPYGAALTQCGQLTVDRLRDALHEALPSLTAEISTQRRSTYDATLGGILSELQRELGRKAPELPQKFAQAFDSLWRERARGQRRSDRLYQPTAGQADTLPNDDKVFSETLAIREQALLLRAACKAELELLLPRIEQLLADRKPTEVRNPLGPEAIAEALKQTCWTLDCSLEAREQLFSQLTRQLAPTLPESYRAILAALEEHAPPADSLATVVADKLRQLQNGAAHGAAPNANAAALRAALAEQRSHAPSEEEQSDEPPTNLARQLFNQAHASPGSRDSAVLEVVAALFDELFDDSRLAPALKALAGRLQAPLLEVALNDPDFFTHREHPARSLIDTLSQAATTWGAELTPDSTLYRVAEPLVRRIRELGEGRSASFAYAQATLHAFLAEQDRIVDRKSAAVAQQLAKRETQELAQAIAREAAARYLDDPTLPEEIRALLHEHWLTVLANAAAQGGENGSAWIEAVATMEGLVWSVRPKPTAEERQQLLRQLPTLLQRLRSGLDQADMSEEACKQFFTRLSRLHARAVQHGMQTVASPAPPPSPADTSPQTLAPDPLDTLQRGSWFELRLEEEDSPSILRLSWVSPARTMYLFSNRQGARAIALTHSELSQRLASGEARPLDAQALAGPFATSVLGTPPPAPEGKS